MDGINRLKLDAAELVAVDWENRKLKNAAGTALIDWATAFTIGSVVFAGTAGLYSQNNTKLFFDNTNIRLGVGIAAPVASIHVKNTASLVGLTVEQLAAAIPVIRIGEDASGNGRIRAATSGGTTVIEINGNTSGTSFFNSGAVAIGATSANANAILDVQSTTKAFMPPRMTTAQKAAIASPTAGMVVYDSTLAKLCVYTTAWETITSA